MSFLFIKAKKLFIAIGSNFFFFILQCFFLFYFFFKLKEPIYDIIAGLFNAIGKGFIFIIKIIKNIV